MTEIEIKNRINFRNIIIFFMIGIVGLVNGIKDFYIYQIPIAKIIFPDPVVYEHVVTLNNSMMSSLSVTNSMSVSGFASLTLFILAAVLIIGLVAGVLGRGAAMGD